MKSYHDIAGDGGSRVVDQVVAQRRRVEEALAGVRHRVAIASGKGGVGKSTVTMALAHALARAGRRVAVLDADMNGPCQARLAGLEGAPWVPGPQGLEPPSRADGVAVVSLGSVLPDGRPLEFSTVSEGEEQTWRATRELSALGQLLESVDWGDLDVLLCDLPPGAERTLQYAQFLPAPTRFVVVTVPSDLARGVVARSLAALAAVDAPVLGYVENMAGYYCHGCGEVRPLFPASADPAPLAAPRLGAIPFDPELAAVCDRGWPVGEVASPAAAAAAEIAGRLLDLLEPSLLETSR